MGSSSRSLSCSRETTRRIRRQIDSNVSLTARSGYTEGKCVDARCTQSRSHSISQRPPSSRSAGRTCITRCSGRPGSRQSHVLVRNERAEAHFRCRTSSMGVIERGRLRCLSICLFLDRGTNAGWVLVGASGFVGLLNDEFRVMVSGRRSDQSLVRLEYFQRLWFLFGALWESNHRSV